MGSIIYLNEFTNINYGVNPVGLNRSTQSSFSGLQVLCNEFEDLIICDIFVKHSLNANNNEGIRDFQGNFFDNLSAGNCFTQTNAATEANLKNNVSQPFFYYFNGVVDPSNCNYPASITPGIISVQQVNDFYCPSHISDGDKLPFDETRENNVIIDYYTAETAYFNLFYSYLQQIDGGCTPTLLVEIQNTWPQEAWDLRNDLMSIAPFVSREALEEAAFSNILPDAILLEVCLANPDATRYEELLRILADDIPNTLPSYMIDIIRDNWDTETTRTLLENGLAHYGAIRDRKCNLLIANAKMKEGATLADLMYWHQQRDKLSDRYSIIDLYISEDDYSNALVELDAIAVDFELTEYQQEVYANYCDYLSFVEGVYSDGRRLDELYSTEISFLNNIASASNNLGAIKAQNILCFYYEMCFEHRENVNNPNKSAKVEHVHIPINEQEFAWVTISPNPATNFVRINWEIKLPLINTKLRITNSKGVKIEQIDVDFTKGQYIWSLQNILSGIYYYEILNNDEQLANGIIIISK